MTGTRTSFDDDPLTARLRACYTGALYDVLRGMGIDRRWGIARHHTELVLAQGFPVFCAFLTPTDIVERWIPDRLASRSPLAR